MREFIDVTGKTEDEAIRKALEQLGLDRDDVSVEILERAKSGFLGLGSCPAKVRVSYGPEEEEVIAPVAVKAEPKVEKPKTEKKAEKPARKETKKKEPRKEPVKEEEAAPAEETAEAAAEETEAPVEEAAEAAAEEAPAEE